MVVIVCKICYIDMAPMEIDLRGAGFSGATPLMAFCMALGFGFCDVVFIFLYGRITGVCGRQIVQCIVDKRFVVFLA